ncbi:MAG: hypothetical protein Q9181_006551 [Wetmoreana brouardii]
MTSTTDTHPPPSTATIGQACPSCGADISNILQTLARSFQSRISELETQVRILTDKATAAATSPLIHRSSAISQPRTPFSSFLSNLYISFSTSNPPLLPSPLVAALRIHPAFLSAPHPTHALTIRPPTTHSTRPTRKPPSTHDLQPRGPAHRSSKRTLPPSRRRSASLLVASRDRRTLHPALLRSKRVGGDRTSRSV